MRKWIGVQLMIEDLENLTTEQINENTRNIDIKSSTEILELINSEDSKVADVVKHEIPNITKAVDVIVEKFKSGGRLFYIGAGTSGRIGILDASECPPTFGTDPAMIQGIIAGGFDAIIKAVEGAEDDESLGRKVIKEKNINKNDVVAGITASGRTPFVLGAIREAKKNGIFTIGISNNSKSIIKDISDIAITPMVGPEVVMGSTRMKSGTSQKLVLNMITTASMIKMGKVYGNLMVDLKPTNLKLMDRAARIIMYAANTDEKTANILLKKSNYNPKTAIVMYKANVNRAEAERLLKDSCGFVTKALNIYTAK